MNYTVLSLIRRFEDYETLSLLFKKCKELILKQILIERIWHLFEKIINTILLKLGIDWEKVITKLIENYDEFMNKYNKSFQIIFAVDINE